MTAIADKGHILVASDIEQSDLPEPARAPDSFLPASSVIVTPHSEFADMTLVEVARGCHRTCGFCVLRKGEGPGMRLVAAEKVVSIGATAKRVGLVGAAVTDHPDLKTILERLIASGRRVSLSSLRADRLDDELVALLARGGLRTITVAADGLSQALRNRLDKRISDRDLIKAAELAKAHNRRLKIYQMIGLPGETNDDIDEWIRLAREISRIVRTVVTITPFVPKRSTPMNSAPFAPLRQLEQINKRLRRGLSNLVELRIESIRWAWVEYLLSQGSSSEGMIAYSAWCHGGQIGAWKRAAKAAASPFITPLVQKTNLFF